MTAPASLCAVSGCGKKSKTRGWCSAHYERWRVHGDVNYTTQRQTCEVPGCGKKHSTKGLCSMHASRLKRTGDARIAEPPRPTYDASTCSVDGCSKPREKRGWCAMHYKRWRSHGDVHVVLNIWHDPATECFYCGRDIQNADKRSRRFCSAACQALERRERVGEVATQCIDCATVLDQEQTASGVRRRGNGRGRCWECAQTPPCPQCGQPRKRSGASLVCRPCRRPRAISDQFIRRARLVNAVCDHGESCITAKFVTQLRSEPCFYCGDIAAHIDHFYPLARNGLHCRDNVVAACAACNLAKGDRDPWEWWERLAN